ncbi:XRE family transcriptional regulator [Streptomyces triticagri]|uniref:XRE family transcriptional regulator n=1 Tax=Streptomyces triticagri TaxID=2293568 RepID=A0A372M425_9ACTN|nr:XRE family transcriptional regulator [Streptomyces triticagri]RFU85686.1 XRE family transcriptional regulator [Streptomyces triticagri]
MSDLDQLTRSLARNLRYWRGERGYTLDALAARSGVSRGMIIQIEQARTNPSVGTTVKLADALGVSITTLLDHEQEAEVRVVPAEQAVRMWSTEQGSWSRLLVSAWARGPFELWSLHFEPGEGSDSDAHLKDTVELLHVTAGELTLVVDGVEHRVPAGGSVTFEANAPHGYHNRGREPLELTMAVSIPPAG